MQKFTIMNKISDKVAPGAVITYAAVHVLVGDPLLDAVYAGRGLLRQLE